MGFRYCSAHYYSGRMQATIATFDEQTTSGTVLFDDGVQLPFSAAAFAGGRMRFARVGQRVKVKVEQGEHGPTITSLTLATF